MPAINSENRDAWQAIANKLSAQRPYVGRVVRVTKGKRAGTEGTVQRHQQSRFQRDAFRYGNDASFAYREMAGRYGYCVLVNTGAETFWINADNVECIDGKHQEG